MGCLNWERECCQMRYYSKLCDPFVSISCMLLKGMKMVALLVWYTLKTDSYITNKENIPIDSKIRCRNLKSTSKKTFCQRDRCERLDMRSLTDTWVSDWGASVMLGYRFLSITQACITVPNKYIYIYIYIYTNVHQMSNAAQTIWEIMDKSHKLD